MHPLARDALRVAVELQNALDYEINGSGGLISPTHALKVRMVVGRSSIITDVATGRVEAEVTGIDANFTLTELATGKDFAMPILHLSQLIGVAAGLPESELKFRRHVISVKPVLERLDA